MKTKDLCKQYGFDRTNFENYLKKSKYKYESGFTSLVVQDSDVKDIAAEYTQELLRLKKEKEEREAAEAIEAAKKKKALSEMLITSGFNFDGYTIKKYSGYISGDDCVTIPRNSFWGDKNKLDEELCPALVKIRRQAIKELKEAAYALGCNAVIGVDFDYLTMDPQHANGWNRQITEYEPYVICVTANGNAVIIEKDE